MSSMRATLLFVFAASAACGDDTNAGGGGSGAAGAAAAGAPQGGAGGDVGVVCEPYYTSSTTDCTGGCIPFGMNGNVFCTNACDSNAECGMNTECAPSATE